MVILTLVCPRLNPEWIANYSQAYQYEPTAHYKILCMFPKCEKMFRHYALYLFQFTWYQL